MGSVVKSDQETLGDPKILEKVDKLRELRIDIPLPQLVVVGDQSSGKSSVLEGLTGFSFPRDVGLCTRYATQITLRRHDLAGVTISIIPRPGADPKLMERLQQFHRQVPDIQGHEIAKIFVEANKVMGIRPANSSGSDSDSLIAFSEDILRIEISGPKLDHLTVIDVPGIFCNVTEGVTSESDIPLVCNMVKKYMQDARTIILAVMPCTVDIATQEVLKLAKDADPEGIRTMVVLTKPDLAIEQATKQAVLDLVKGKRHGLRLGYTIVKNRDADDNSSSLADRHA